MLTAFSFSVNPVSVRRYNDEINNENEIILKDKLIVHTAGVR
jgi:hypothetical protein